MDDAGRDLEAADRIFQQELPRSGGGSALQGESDKPAEGNYPGRRAQDYKELIDHLGGSPVVLVGWSLAVHEALTYVEMFGTYKLNGAGSGRSERLHALDSRRT